MSPFKLNTPLTQEELNQARLLREHAEKLAQEQATLASIDMQALSGYDTIALIHELQVHQIELQLQNDELKVTQENLEVSRTRFIDLYNMAPVGYVTLNSQGIVTEVNNTAGKLLGLPRESILGKPLTLHILANDQDIYYMHNKHLNNSGTMHVCELRMVVPGGDLFWARLETTRHQNPETKENEYYCAISDVSAKKRHEQILVEQYRLLQALINNPLELIFSLDTEGRLTAFNKSYGEQMQMLWNKEIRIGDRIADYMSIPDANAVKHNIKRALHGERFVNILNAPQNVCFEMTWTPIYNETAEVVGLTVFVRDVTDRKQAEDIIRNNNVFLEERVKERTDELVIARNDLEAFSTSIAHDLSVSLQTIDGFAHTLLEDETENLSVEAKRLLQVIRLNALKMEGFVKALQSTADISCHDVSQSIINMDKLVTQTWEGIPDTQDVSIIIPPDLPKARGDFRLLQVVWQNLLSNAVKFTRNQSLRSIIVTGIIKDDFAEYCVEDNGIGFDMKHYDMLFQIFHKFHNDQSYEGTGIGLSIAQRIVKMHGGQIWATSQEGKGARFYFKLPVVI